MKVFVLIERTSIEYEGSSDEIKEVHLDKDKAIARKNYMNKYYGKCGFKEVSYFIDSHEVIE